MELDERQGDLFLRVLQGGKSEPLMNFRSKFDAVVSEGRSAFNKESPVPEGQTPMVQSGKQDSG